MYGPPCNTIPFLRLALHSRVLGVVLGESPFGPWSTQEEYVAVAQLLDCNKKKQKHTMDLSSNRKAAKGTKRPLTPSSKQQSSSASPKKKTKSNKSKSKKNRSSASGESSNVKKNKSSMDEYVFLQGDDDDTFEAASPDCACLLLLLAASFDLTLIITLTQKNNRFFFLRHTHTHTQNCYSRWTNDGTNAQHVFTPRTIPL